MNEQRRKVLAGIAESVQELVTQIEETIEEEQESFDNLPEGIPGSERGDAMENAIGELEYARDALEEVPGFIESACE